ncbi:MAG TPA: kelch repeat-containing protein [Chthoniobacterales bacterium]|nr:kelch repeat-containing protein [Chthoniobacterales bacterium]
MFPFPSAFRLERALRSPVCLTLFLGVGLILVAQPCHARSAGFETTGNLAQVRRAHTATLLSDGRVLVAGGDIADGFSGTIIDSAELYDPASRSWSATGSLINGRTSHTATLLPDGKVLLVGGRNTGGDLATAELYDPATGTWMPTGRLNTQRRSHAATLLPNGKVLVTGGLQGGSPGANYSALSSAELYDPATGTWTITGSLGAARGDHTSTLLASGKVLVVGGRPRFSGQDGNPRVTTVELYDPATGNWSSTGSLNFGRSGHTATLMPNGEVLAAAGFNDGDELSSAEIYNPTTGTWRTTANLARSRGGHTATLLPSKKVLIAGGFFDHQSGSVGTAELFDPTTETWMPTGGLVTTREEHTATLLPDGTVLIAGGSTRASTELYVNAVPTLLNLSTRMHVQTENYVLIAGFIIAGTAQKTVIVRGMGPSVPVPGALADPVIEVHGPSGELLGTNDNWKDAATRQQISDSGLAPGNDLESALWGTINPGAYTVVLSGKNGETGVGSVEIYDLDEPADSRLANISTRGYVENDDNVMIAGVIVGGGSSLGSANVLVRALGPSIPMNYTLADPTLELYDANGNVIAFNDDWKWRPDGSYQQEEISATRLTPYNEMESALVRRLPPANYTAIVRGKNNTAGLSLVEVYNLQ